MSSNDNQSKQFKSHDIGLNIQKKLLGNMTNKKIVKALIDADSSRLMDNLHRLLKLYYRKNNVTTNNKSSKEIPDKIIKYLIKITIKITILILNNQFSNEEMNDLHKIQQTIRSILMTIVSFHQIDFSYDLQYLQLQMRQCNQQLKQLIQNHLSDKSQQRIDFIFNHLNEQKLLDNFFTTTIQKDKLLYELKSTIIDDINHLLERKNW